MARVEMWEDLPEECWETIFSLLHSDLESLSLVSKRFLALSNRLRSCLAVSSSASFPSSLLSRFPHITHLQILPSAASDLDRLLLLLSNCRLPLLSLDISHQPRFPSSSIHLLRPTPLRSLLSSHLHFLSDSDLSSLSAALPHLHSLDISNPRNDYPSLLPAVTDLGISALSSNLPSLRSIDISGNAFLSDQSLLHLSANCPLLRQIVARNCTFLTDAGVNSAIRNLPHLDSLAINGSLVSSSPATIDTFRSRAPALRCLDLSQMYVSDDLLFAIGDTGLALRRLVLSQCRGFTLLGISAVLRSCPSIAHLDLERTDFLTDSNILALSEHLRNLISVGLNSCTRLSSSALFNLVKNCPSLEEIGMEGTNLGVENSAVDLVKNCSVRYLNLAWNKRLSDKTLRKIGSVCSEIKSLDLSHCWRITEQGISAIGMLCPEVTELRISGCQKVQGLGPSLAFSKLEVLVASSSGIGDSGLTMVAQSCPRLRVLALKGCLRVTEIGVKAVVGSDSSCRVLRDLNLKSCYGISAGLLSRMVFSSTSLRKVVAPVSAAPMPQRRALFLQHGCTVSIESNLD